MVHLVTRVLRVFSVLWSSDLRHSLDFRHLISSECCIYFCWIHLLIFSGIKTSFKRYIFALLLNGSAKNVWYLLYLLTRSNLEFLLGSFWDPLKKYYNLKSRSRLYIHVGWNFIIIFWHSASRIGEVMSMKVNESQIIQAWLTKYLNLRENNHNQNSCLLWPHVSTHSDCSNKRLNIPVSHVCIVGEQVILSVVCSLATGLSQTDPVHAGPSQPEQPAQSPGWK